MSSSKNNTNQNSVTNQQPNPQAPAPPAGPGSGSQATKSWASIAGKTALPTRPAASTGPTPSMPPAPSAIPATFATPAAEQSVVSPAASSTASSAVAAPASPAAPATPLKVFAVPKGESNVVSFPCKVDTTTDNATASVATLSNVEGNINQKSTLETAGGAHKASSAGANAMSTTDRDMENASANTTSHSTSKGASKVDGEKKAPLPSLVDQKYAPRLPRVGMSNSEVVKDSILVNQFEVKRGSLPKKICRYSIHFPPLQGRSTAPNPRLKRIMIAQALQQQNFNAGFQTQNTIYTDWKARIVSKSPVADRNGVTLMVGSDPLVIEVSSPSLPGGATTTHYMHVSRLEDLDINQFLAYIDNQKSQTFNFLEFTDVFNIMSKHFANQLTRPEQVPLSTKEKLFAPQLGPVSNFADLERGLHARQAFFNSIRPVESGVRLHLNALASAFFTSVNLRDFFNEFAAASFDEFRAVTRGLLVYRTYPTAGAAPNAPPALKRINGYGERPYDQWFTLDDGTSNGTRHRVLHYFINILNVPVNYRDLPVVNIGGNANDQKVWVPMELLFIADNQRFSPMLEGNQTSKMISFARKDPNAQSTAILGDGMNRLDRQRLSSQRVMDISPNMIITSGRHLFAPHLRYRESSTDGTGGKWNMTIDDGSGRRPHELPKRRFKTGSGLNHLRVLQIVRDRKDLNIGRPSFKDVESLSNALNSYGITPTNGNQRQISRRVMLGTDKLYEELGRELEKFQPEPQPGDVVLVIFGTNSRKIHDEYAIVKRWADTAAADKGIHTVCLTSKKINKLTDGGFQANLALKFNTKLGGTNHLLSEEAVDKINTGKRSTMIVGADVTHPGAGSANFCPSIAAVVATTDRQAVKYPGSMRLQAGRTEQIVELSEMMVERFQAWGGPDSKDLPDDVLFYRDGVSESQFSMVKGQELPAIRQAVTEIKKRRGNIDQWNPNITIVVCTKRHQTRFFSNNKTPKKFTDRTRNFRPGLVVDDAKVRLPYYYDFFLQSHSAIIGTARPCHYFVIHNDMNLDPNRLQEITYNLCYAYATALTPISMAAPAYYADKLCERGRAYMRPILVPRGNTSLLDHLIRPQLADDAHIDDKRREVARKLNAGQGGNLQVYWPRSAPNPAGEMLKNSMFYI